MGRSTRKECVVQLTFEHRETNLEPMWRAFERLTKRDLHWAGFSLIDFKIADKEINDEGGYALVEDKLPLSVEGVPFASGYSKKWAIECGLSAHDFRGREYTGAKGFNKDDINKIAVDLKASRK